eukprot:295409_1
MSASEIITVIKAINDHVTNKYSQAIVTYFNEKANAHLLFEREFFNTMDQAVQRLINDITGSLKPISSTRPHLSVNPKNILGHIQKHCNKYNQAKKNMYDNHLSKIKEFEKKFSKIIQQTLKEKVIHQNNLFDTALQKPLSPQNINQDIITLLQLCQDSQNAQEVQNNAPNTANVNLSKTPTVNLSNTPNMQDVQNALFTMNNTTPMQTSSPPNGSITNNANIDNLNQINQFLSIISDTVNAYPYGPGNDNANKMLTTPNGDGNVLIKSTNGTGIAVLGVDVNELINQNNSNNNNNNGVKLSQNILNDISMNGVSPSQNVNNINNINNINNNSTQTNNNNNNNNSMSNTNFPLLPPLPLNKQNTKSVSNDNIGGLQLQN